MAGTAVKAQARTGAKTVAGTAAVALYRGSAPRSRQGSHLPRGLPPKTLELTPLYSIISDQL